MSRIQKNASLMLLKLLSIQLLLVASLAGIIGGFLGLTAAFSVLLGGAVCVIPGLLFARLFFKYKGAQQAKQSINAFYIGEMIKILATIGLFMLTLLWANLNFLSLLLGFIAAQLAYWIILFYGN